MLCRRRDGRESPTPELLVFIHWSGGNSKRSSSAPMREDALENRMSKRRRAIGAPFRHGEAHSFKVALQGLRINAFGQAAGGIQSPLPRVQAELVAPHLLLDPKVRNRQMADAALFSAPAKADCCGRVRVDIRCQGNPEILCKRSQPESSGRPLADALQFCLAAAEAYCWLGERPALNKVAPSH